MLVVIRNGIKHTVAGVTLVERLCCEPVQSPIRMFKDLPANAGYQRDCNDRLIIRAREKKSGEDNNQHSMHEVGKSIPSPYVL